LDEIRLLLTNDGLYAMSRNMEGVDL